MYSENHVRRWRGFFAGFQHDAIHKTDASYEGVYSDPFIPEQIRVIKWFQETIRFLEGEEL